MATVMDSGSVMLRPSQKPGTATTATLALLVTEAPTPLATQLLPQSMDTLLDTPPDMATVMVSGSVMLRPTLRQTQRPGTATTATLALLAMEAPTPLATQLLPQSTDTLLDTPPDMATVMDSGSVRPSLTPKPGTATMATLAWDMVVLIPLLPLPAQCMATPTLDTELDTVSGELIITTKSMQTGSA